MQRRVRMILGWVLVTLAILFEAAQSFDFILIHLPKRFLAVDQRLTFVSVLVGFILLLFKRQDEVPGGLQLRPAELAPMQMW